MGYLPTWLSPGTAIDSVDLDKVTHITTLLFNPTTQLEDKLLTLLLEHYPTGMYILKLATDQGTVARKIVKH